MSIADRTLNLVLKYKWFDLINSGQKTHEYREGTPHWNKYLGGNNFDKVRFQRGYSKNAATMDFNIKSINFTFGKTDLGNGWFWDIELGERLK